MKYYFIDATCSLSTIDEKRLNGIFQIKGAESIEDFVKDKFGVQHLFNHVTYKITYHTINLL